MIIVSQDKEDIINLDNVKMITVDENIIGIDASFAKADFYEIGAYDNKERAKEILQEIIKFFIRNEYQNKVFRMPES